MSTATTSFSTIPGYGPQSMLLIERLKTGKPGDILTDEELTAICGRNTASGGKGCGALSSAIRYCTANHGIVWQRERGASAIKCLNSSEVVNKVRSSASSIHRKAGRTLKVAATVKLAELTPEEVRDHNVLCAQIGAVRLFASGDTRKKLEARNATSVPDIGKLIEQFK